jgi:quercetin dioxygenase-like cupin family protein
VNQALFRVLWVLGLASGFASTAGLLGPRAARARATEKSEEQRIAETLQSALVAHGGEVHRCFEKALADTLDVAGKIELAVDVGDDGRVTRAVPAVDEVKSPVLLACLEESAQLWSLVGIDAGSTVIVPLTFAGQMAQFSVKVADAPDHGPPAPVHKRRGLKPGVSPFSVKLLVDEATMHATQASLSLLTVSPANRISMHKHPGAEILYVLKGHGRVLGPPGTPPERIDEGTAIFIPPGMPHVIENMARQAPAVMLEIFAPPGPERVYRDPKDEAGRAAFEVIRDPRRGLAPEGAHFVVATAGKGVSVAGGKGRTHKLLDGAALGDGSIYVGLLEMEPGADLTRHTHEGSAEILYVISGGGGELTVGSEKIKFGAEQAIHLPENQPHSLRFHGDDKTVLLQIYAPAGPEQRLKAEGRKAEGKVQAKVREK